MSNTPTTSTSPRRPVKTWPRPSNMRRERTCVLCKLPMGWDDKYRSDGRTQIVWHVACETEQARRFAKLEPWLAKLPTIVPTFPTPEWIARAREGGYLPNEVTQ